MRIHYEIYTFVHECGIKIKFGTLPSYFSVLNRNGPTNPIDSIFLVKLIFGCIHYHIIFNYLNGNKGQVKYKIEGYMNISIVIVP